METENEANKTHFMMGKRVREFIEENGGVLPENCPTPKKSLKELEKERKKLQIKNEDRKKINKK